MLIFGWNTENIHWEKEKLSIFHGNFRLQYHRIADPMSGKTACVWKRKMWELALLQKKNRHHRRHQAKNLVILKPLVSKPERCRNQAFHGHQKPLPQTEFPLDEAHTPEPKGYRVDLGSATVPSWPNSLRPYTHKSLTNPLDKLVAGSIPKKRRLRVPWQCVLT